MPCPGGWSSTWLASGSAGAARLVSWFSPSGASAALWMCLSVVTRTLSPIGLSRFTCAPGAEPRPTAATQRTGLTGPATDFACSFA